MVKRRKRRARRKVRGCILKIEGSRALYKLESPDSNSYKLVWDDLDKEEFYRFHNNSVRDERRKQALYNNIPYSEALYPQYKRAYEKHGKK